MVRKRTRDELPAFGIPHGMKVLRQFRTVEIVFDAEARMVFRVMAPHQYGILCCRKTSDSKLFFKYTSELETALAQYTELQQETIAMDSTDLDTARQAIRPAKECETIQRLQTTYGKKFDSRTLAQSQMDVAEMLDETAESVSIRQENSTSCRDSRIGKAM